MIYPLITMLGLVLLMFGIAFCVRMYAAAKGHVSLEYYKLFEGRPAPDYVTQVSNNLNNLFQVPPIFYTAAVLAIALNNETQTMLFHAWGFVVARYAHTLVHITFNTYLVRSLVFAVSLFFLVALWIELIISL